ncbi:MAG: hypothetical protein ACTSUE_01685 [Promethearchaeota archaeon]
MIEKLYSPDFSAIFDEEFANPFLYEMVDSLQWPLFADIEFPTETKNLLAFNDERGHSLFYRRKISTSQWIIERQCASIGHVFFQAFFLDKDHNISNSQVIAACQKVSPRASAIVCPNFTEFDVDYMINNAKYISGVVFYPLFQKLDPTSEKFKNVINYCNENKIPVKWDFHEFSIPQTKHLHDVFYSIVSLFKQYKDVIFIISGLDLGGIEELAEKMKYYPRLWMELDHRVLGGMPPGDFFKRVFSIPGLIQNCWDRIVVGSTTPTLEASQLTRGIWDATEDLPFNLKSLLRTWILRNALRLFKIPLHKVCLDNKFLNIKRSTMEEAQRTITAFPGKKQAIISYKLTLQSFSITQLLWIQRHILNAWEKIRGEFKNIEVGELLIRSYHTTTSLIMNEHERGNYLQLHYDLAQKTRLDATKALHTVAAEENRADFNYPDHILASSVGNRAIIIPISHDNLDMGSRENYYIIVTFGPRSVNILLRFSFYFT